MSILVNSLLTIAGLYMVSSLTGKLLKLNAELYFPRCDDEGEIEALLADGLILEFSKQVA